MEKISFGLKTPERLKLLVDSMSGLTREVTITADKEGLHARTMDPANVAMVIWNWNSVDLQDYTGEGKFTIISQDLKDALKRTKKDAYLTMTIEESRMTIVTDDGSTKRTAKIPIMGDEQEQAKEPALRPKVRAILGAKTWVESIEDASDIAESIKLICEDGQLRLTADTETKSTVIELRQAEITQDPDLNESGLPIPGKATIKGKYSQEYLKKMLEPAKVADQVEMSWGNDYPLLIQYKIEGLEIKYVLAPRVDNQ